MTSHASISSPEKQKLHLPLALTRLWDSVVEAHIDVFLFTLSSDLFIVHSQNQYSTAFNWPLPSLPQTPDLAKEYGCFSPSVVSFYLAVPWYTVGRAPFPT